MRSQIPKPLNALVLKMGPRQRAAAVLQRDGGHGKVEETLVPDDRSNVRPAHVIDAKLLRMLKSAFVPVSQVLERGLIGRHNLS